MKKAILVLLSIIYSTPVIAQLTIPSLSTSASITQSIGLSEIAVEYSRPSAKGRKIFGENGLLPYQIAWRTGANNATKITFSENTIIGGIELEKGSYTLISYPGASEWEIQWYPYTSNNWLDYLDEDPIITLNIPVKTVERYVETFEIRIQDITLDSGILLLEWENTALHIPIHVDEKERITTSIERTLSGPSNADYFQAALYLHETQSDLEKALDYIKKVTSSDNALFFQVTREAQILMDLKMYDEALVSAKRALELSKKVDSKDFIRLNQKLIKELSSK